MTDGLTAARRPRQRGVVVALKVLAGLVTAALLTAYLAGMAGLGSVRRSFAPLEVQFSASPGPETWVIVGEDDPDERTVTGEGDGSRADIIVLVTATPSGTTFTSVPRDLTVSATRGARPTRLAMSWLRGPQPFVDAMCWGLGVPVDHLVRVDVKAFGALVDGVGGIDVTLAQPLRQGKLLELPAGTSHLDGDKALRYVRMRHAQIPQGERWVEEPDGPLRRQQRSMQVLEGVVTKARQDPRLAARTVQQAAPLVGVDRSMVWRDVIPMVGRRQPVHYLPGKAVTDVIVQPTDETAAAIARLGYTGCSR